MFDIGFGELLLIAVVALVVLGPERLPKAARFAGLWIRRARNQWDSVKQELERELQAEELQRNLRNVRQSVQQAERELQEGATQLHGQVDALRREVDSPAASAPAEVAGDGAQQAPALPAPAAGADETTVEAVDPPRQERAP
ncbi:MAG: twin-arginine translocase subunit TatB [Stenotrophomonas nitritireducens]|uniref:Sec-independent protein translocase protein TatB n=1 Tax=Stenotrophomonas nitritireducens TaxID=83617 RepID=UPI001AD5D932|nr:Sec-independent protein translocase protein TatB [Stenotrophomonas nitritireducens]MBN8793286.1 twin-arginine translocase subunit TatB [Stenotrophomonas nitritireducens]MBN8797317.1 twin-arginine translocase subunit TatB [Stenotrophomonas nitritireducens]